MGVSGRIAAVGAAALVAVAVNVFGVVFFFRPIEEADSVGTFSQIILVADLVLRGERGLATGALPHDLTLEGR